MKFNNVRIQYDKNGDVTEKLGKDVVSVLILPNAQILELSVKKSYNEDNVFRIEKQKLKSIRLLIALKLE